MPKIRANGVNINYALSGKGDQVVALIHGLSDSMAEWNYQVPALEPHFRVLRYDIRGHGGSETGDAEGSTAQMAQDLRELLRALDIPRAHLAGFSMGGVITQRFALDYPGVIQSAFILGSSSTMNRQAHQWFHHRIKLAEEGGLEALRETNQADAVRCIVAGGDQIRAEYIRLRTTSLNDIKGYIACCRAMADLHQHPLTPELSRIRCPTLVATAAHDASCPPRASEIIAEQIPGVRLVIIPKGGHCVHMEMPEVINPLMLEFLTSEAVRGGSGVSGEG